MDYHGDPALRLEVHPLVKLLWESGVQYEAKVFEALKAQSPEKRFAEISPDLPLSPELFEQTQQAMTEGYDFIYQGVIISGNLVGRPDLLIKTPGQSDLGNYHYAPMDIKLARVEDTWDDGNEKVTKEQLWQIFYYADILEKTQGLRPHHGYIYKTKSRKLSVNLSKPNEQYKNAIDQLNGYLKSPDALSEPALNANCKMCEWKSVCIKRIEEENDCTRVYFVGSAMQKGLRKIGIKTVDDLACQNSEELKEKVNLLKGQGYFWKSLSDTLIEKSISRAKIFKSGKQVIHENINFPEHQIEIHYDLEDDPTQDFVYLHGLVLSEQGKKPEYYAFFAESINDEKVITEQLFEFFKKHAGAPVYHYSPYEKTTLKRLIGKYSGLDSGVFEMLFGEKGTAIDLLKIINDKTDWPLSSYSIKDICRYLGFAWDATDASGAASIVWMNDYLNGNKELKSKILRYNEDDCMATLFLKRSISDLQNKASCMPDAS
jgi:uncharacterized protein